jgi:hypothetical protein
VVKAWARRVVGQVRTPQAVCITDRQVHPMLIPMSPELNFLYLMQERMREAAADRLVDLARQHTKAQRAGVGDSSRKDNDR